MNVLIGTHGELSKSFLETARLIIGENITFNYFCMVEGKSVKEGEDELREILASYENDNTVVLVDLMGGSVSNILVGLLSEFSFQLIAGVNLPMVLTTFLSIEGELDENDISTIINESKQGIVHINSLMNNREDDLDDLFIEG